MNRVPGVYELTVREALDKGSPGVLVGCAFKFFILSLCYIFIYLNCCFRSLNIWRKFKNLKNKLFWNLNLKDKLFWKCFCSIFFPKCKKFSELWLPIKTRLIFLDHLNISHSCNSYLLNSYPYCDMFWFFVNILQWHRIYLKLSIANNFSSDARSCTSATSRTRYIIGIRSRWGESWIMASPWWFTYIRTSMGTGTIDTIATSNVISLWNWNISARMSGFELIK